MTVRLDNNATKVSVQLCMPLSLQLFCKQAGVGADPNLCYAGTAAINAIRMPCISMLA